jgi:hypothetical protein
LVIWTGEKEKMGYRILVVLKQNLFKKMFFNEDIEMLYQQKL